MPICQCGERLWAVRADLKQPLKNRFPFSEQAALQGLQPRLSIERLPFGIGEGPLETGVIYKYIELVFQKIVKPTQTEGERFTPGKIHRGVSAYRFGHRLEAGVQRQ